MDICIGVTESEQALFVLFLVEAVLGSWSVVPERQERRSIWLFISISAGGRKAGPGEV